MIDAKDSPSIRPYLIRALYEWCTDNGFTPYIAVSVDNSVRVPLEFVKDGEIVLNISLEATSSLTLGNETIDFKGRFGGVARDILVPVSRVIAIYARENGQGMAFPRLPAGVGADSRDRAPVPVATPVAGLSSVTTLSAHKDDGNEPEPPRPGGNRPTLTRVK